jgi:lysozyme family protein
MGNLTACHAVTAKWEGGKDDDPRDPGGRTNQGVTQARYDEYRKDMGQPKKDVWQMADVERDAIYRRYYWNPVRGDDLPDPVAIEVYDYGVNSGPGRSSAVLNYILGRNEKVTTVDATTLKMIAVVDQAKLVNAINRERQAFLRSLKTFPTFGNGWINRCNDVYATAVSWLVNVPHVAPTPPTPTPTPPVKKPAPGKAVVPVDKNAQAGTTGGAGAGAGGAATAATQDPSHAWVWILVALILAAAAVGAYFYFKHRAKKKQLEPMPGHQLDVSTDVRLQLQAIARGEK